MILRRPLLLGLLSVLAPLLHAQIATNSVAKVTLPATLPLRNLQIEVRQVRHDDAQGTGSTSEANVHSTQRLVVLNGRKARIALRNSTPLRLMQTFVRNGTLLITQGSLLLESGTGFVATPRWDGSEWVELEIAARNSDANTASQLSSVLMVPLGEWTMVARSEQSYSASYSGPGGSTSQAEQTDTDLELRLTVR